MIEIVVKGEAGVGKSTLASHIATILYNEGFDVVVSSSDEIRSEYATKERLDVIKQQTIVSIETEQLPRNTKNEPHPSHDLEWRDSSHYEFVCRKCNTADTPSGWGKLLQPCKDNG